MRKCDRGYFQFESRDDGLYITIFPPVSGDKPVTVSEALYYIDKKKILDCDVAKLSVAFKKGETSVVTEKVSSINTFAMQEFGDYKLSPDCMRLEAVFYPPFVDGKELSYEEIKRDLNNLGIKSGINENEIQRFLNERRYYELYLLAEGKNPREGTDGSIEYMFNTELKPKPKMNEDGTVDFHTLENVNHVKVGDVVAVLHPEDRGEPGCDLLGRNVMPKKVKHVMFRNGNNLVVSESGKELVSKVNGHVILEGDKIFVSDVMEVVDVDASTGDIDYQGSVLVKGNVLAGFSVKASGDVTVSGIVEGANITAGGNITFNRGVQGMNKAVIKAGGNIVTKFIESAKLVQAGGKIETDSILHSKVNANGPITASGKNGLIVGGDVRSTILVEAKNIGNEMGTATVIGVGVDPTAKKRIDELKDSLQKIGDNKIHLNQVLTALRKKQDAEGKLSSDKIELQQKTMRNLLLLDKELNEQKKEYESLKEQVSEDGNARIKVLRNIYVGTKLVFGDQSYFVKEKAGFCQYLKERADIKWYTL